jgi:oligosaccharide repeat unit polymerase
MSIPHTKLFVIISAIVILNTTFLYFLITESTIISQYIRFDKYPIHINVERAFITIIVLLITLYVFHRVIFPLNKLIFLPSNLFLFLFLVLVLPGILLSSDYTIIGITSFYTYIGAFICYIIGSAITSLLMKFDSNPEVIRYQTLPITTYRPGGITYSLMGVILIVSISFTMFHADFRGGIISSILEFIKTGMVPEYARNIADDRLFVYREGSYRTLSVTVNSYITGLLLPLSTSFILASGIVHKNRFEILLGIFLSLITFAALISEGSRLRGMFYILFLIVLISHIRPIKFNTLIYSMSAVFGLLVLQTIALGRMIGGESYFANIIMSINRVIERIILVKGFVTQQVFHYIPWVSDYRMGETYIESLAGTLHKGSTLAEEMSHFIFGPAGTAGPQAFGEAYANYGVIGALIVALVLGFVIQLITILIIRQHSRSLLSLVFSCYLIVLVARTGYGDLFTFKTNGAHVLFIIWIIVIACQKFITTTCGKKIIDKSDI